MPELKRSLASIRLYDVGEGDPLQIDRGFACHDILLECGLRGAFEVNSSAVPKLELLPEIGLTNRPFLTLKDTRLTHYTCLPSGDWEEVRPDGGQQLYRLLQSNSADAVQWSATSTWQHPADPHCAVEFLLPSTPPDWTTATYPPYVRIELGVSNTSEVQWALQWTKDAGYLLRNIGGTLTAVMELPQPPRGAGYSDAPETSVVFIRVLRSRIGISVDYGRTYTWYGSPADPVTVRSGKLVFRGQGGQALFGLHQLDYVAGYWTSESRNTFVSRITSPTIAGRYDAPASSTVAFTDLSVGATGYAQYRATLTPASQISTPFTFKACPVLYSATLRYAPGTTATSNDYTTPWDTRLKSVDVEKPFELSEASASWEVQVDPGDTTTLDHRDRKVQVRLGTLFDDDSEDWTTVFTGYITDVQGRWDGYGRASLVFTARAITERLAGEGVEWTPLDVLPLSLFGTIQAASDYLLSRFGMDSSYRTWHVNGLVTLPLGLPEDPCELIRPRERPWETLTRLWGYVGCEIAATDVGQFLALPLNYVSGTNHDLAANGETLAELAEHLSRRLDYSQRSTLAMVTGRNESGTGLLAWARDAAAEDVIASGRFTQIRRIVQEELPGTASLALASSRAAALAVERFGLPDRVDLGLYVNTDVARRDQVTLNGAAELGIPDGTLHVVMTLHHHWDISDDGKITASTVAGVARL